MPCSTRSSSWGGRRSGGRSSNCRSIFLPAYRGGLLLHTLIATGGLLVLALAGSLRRLDAAILLPGLLFGLLGLRSIRGITEFAVLVPALLAVHGGWIGRRVLLACGVALGTLLLSLAGGALFGLRGVPLGENVRRPLGFGVNPARAPEEAVRFLEKVRPEERMFNVLVFGGYLIHTLWPEYPVYIDGRLDVFPPGFLDDYGDLMRTGRGWDEICRRHGITIAVVDYARDPGRATGLRARLRNDPDWTCVFFSGNALVYLRRGAGNDTILSRYGCPYDPGDRPPESIWRWAAGAPPVEVSQAISSLEAMAAVVPRNPFHFVVLGQMLDACGRSAEGAAWMRRALALEPPPPEALLLFGGTLMRAGDLDEARRQVETVLAEEPARIDGLLLQAEVELRDGDSGAARRILERAARLSTGTYHIWLRLGILSADEGGTGEAEAYFRRALALRPGDPEVGRRLEALHDPASP